MITLLFRKIMWHQLGHPVRRDAPHYRSNHQMENYLQGSGNAQVQVHRLCWKKICHVQKSAERGERPLFIGKTGHVFSSLTCRQRTRLRTAGIWRRHRGHAVFLSTSPLPCTHPMNAPLPSRQEFLLGLDIRKMDSVLLSLMLCSFLPQ